MKNQLGCELKDIIPCISNIMEELVVETEQAGVPNNSCFHAPKKPSISINQYLNRVAKYCQCSNESYIIALVYLDRIQSMHDDILLNGFSVHRFLLTSIMVAIKWQDDEFYKNEYYARIGGISLNEMNILEIEFLKMIDFQLFVDLKILTDYIVKLQQYIG